MMRTVHLYGAAGRRFGRQHRFDVESPAEATRALIANFPEIRLLIADLSWQVIRGPRRRGDVIDETRLGWRGQGDYHFVPMLAGAGGRGGTGKIILGSVLLAAALILAPPVVGALGPTLGMATSIVSVAGLTLTYGGVATFGLGLILTGVVQMMTPQPKRRETQTAAANQSFGFSGPVNINEEGTPVPLAYGKCLTGSVVGAASIKSEDFVSGQHVTTPAFKYGKVGLLFGTAVDRE
jgi:predicted phage tail protein